MVDTRDLKSLARKGVWVQVPPGVLEKKGATDRHPNHAEIAQLVEHDLAKVGVASSSLVFRSKKRTLKCCGNAECPCQSPLPVTGGRNQCCKVKKE